MSFLLAGVSIRRPMAISESNSTQVAQVRTLSGAINRDYFGSNKRTWQLDYKNVTPAEQSIIKAIYTSYLATGVVKTFESTEAAYIIAQASCHVDLAQRKFTVAGITYLSDFTVILTEA